MPLFNEDDIPSIDVRINGPFNDKDAEEMKVLLRDFIRATNLRDDRKYFRRAMYLVQAPNATAAEQHDGLRLDDYEREMLEHDHTPTKSHEHAKHTWTVDFSKWHLSGPLWRLVALCAVGAATQGWDESVVNGAQLYYSKDLAFADRRWFVGLINGAPYLCCVISCWFTPFLNRHFGRRGTILITAIFSAVFALAQAFAKNWKMLFAFRLLMGIGIGPKSATIPVYTSESSPANVRGSLVMLWQVFTAVGIMFGCVSGVIFQNIGKNNWRIMLASPMVPPLILAAYIYTQPESPRWCVARGHYLKANGRPFSAQKRYQEAFSALQKLRLTKLQAARDMFLIYHLLHNERNLVNLRRDDPRRAWYQKGIFELFSERRNRRATLASLICMFAQQFCGVNVIIYYSNSFLDNPKYFSRGTPLLFTMGFGIINFVFALPAFYLIDTIGRRSLLLITFPFLALFQLWIAIAFALSSRWENSWRLALAGMYAFGIAYSPGEGPIPFVYAAESMPLYIRDLGMSLVISINWLFNWMIAFTWPEFFGVFRPWGAFLWYAAWCVVLWFLIFFFVPETRSLSLEQLDLVFRQSSRQFAAYALRKARYHIRHMYDKTAERPHGIYQTVGEEDGRDIEMTSQPNRAAWASDSETPDVANNRRPLSDETDDSDSDSEEENENEGNSVMQRGRRQDLASANGRRNQDSESTNMRHRAHGALRTSDQSSQVDEEIVQAK